VSSGLHKLRAGEPPPRYGPHRKRGPKFSEDKDPTLIRDLEQLLSDEVAGNPMTQDRWVRSSTHRLRLRDRLREKGHSIGHCTVYRLLKQMGFRLRGNKKRRGGSRAPGRDEQFQYIASQRKAFSEAALPIISVDTKHKELIGDFLNWGKAWCKHAAEVNEHDFTSAAECRAIPFGLYDVLRD